MLARLVTVLPLLTSVMASPSFSDDGSFWKPLRVGTGALGAGGVEFLPFYNYGGEQGAMPDGADWSRYGFGTPAYQDMFRRALEVHAESGLVMDFTLPGQIRDKVFQPSGMTRAYSGTWSLSRTRLMRMVPLRG
ncbi:uncharacterized protein BDV17DRAFT_293381 [Aspergillus undulatus]|uniref:uncharacterized protein n=1 Tax=Aspergillus undulatus TaxID=1810928 RepID=UPI003CCCF92F